MARYNSNSSVVWKVVLTVVTILVMAFFALSIYCGVEGKSYKEVFTGEKVEIVEDDKTPTDDNKDEEKIVIEDEATKTTVAINLI